MKKPTEKEIKRARAQVENLFTDRDWFEVMKHWEGDCWHRSEVMCGIIVGLQIAANRMKRKQQRGEGADVAAR